MRSSDIPFVLRPIHIVRDSEGNRVAPAPPGHNHNTPTYTGSLCSFLDSFEDPAESQSIRAKIKPYSTVSQFIEWKRDNKIEKNDKKNREEAFEWNPFTYIPERTKFLQENFPDIQPLHLPTEEPMKSIFVWGLKYDTTQEMLATFMSDFGTVQHCHIVHEIITVEEDGKTIHKRDKSRGYGFVEFKHITDAERALSQLLSSVHYLDDAKIRVDVERGRSVYGWLPSRMGGGLGGDKRKSKQSKKTLRQLDKAKRKASRSFRSSRGPPGGRGGDFRGGRKPFTPGRGRFSDRRGGGDRFRRDSRPSPQDGRNFGRFRGDSGRDGGFRGGDRGGRGPQFHGSNGDRRNNFDPSPSRRGAGGWRSDYQHDRTPNRSDRPDRTPDRDRKPFGERPPERSDRDRAPSFDRAKSRDDRTPRSSKFSIFAPPDSRDSPRDSRNQEFRNRSFNGDRRERDWSRGRDQRDFRGFPDHSRQNHGQQGQDHGHSSMRQRRPPPPREDSHDRHRAYRS